jgi:hypothetical protein
MRLRLQLTRSKNDEKCKTAMRLDFSENKKLRGKNENFEKIPNLKIELV